MNCTNKLICQTVKLSHSYNKLDNEMTDFYLAVTYRPQLKCAHLNLELTSLHNADTLCELNV